MSGLPNDRFQQGIFIQCKNGYTGLQPQSQLDYQTVLLSRGDLTKAESAKVTTLSPTELQFKWTDNSGTGKALATDQVYVALFNPENKNWFYRMNVATRRSGRFVLDWTKVLVDPSPYLGKPLQAYIGIISDDKKDASDSVYIGQVNA